MIGTTGLHGVSACVESCLRRSPDAIAAARAAPPGLLVLALDGLASHAAAQALAHAELAAMRSTFPSTSATAWLTSVTGLDASEPGAGGSIFRAPGSDRLGNAVTG